MVNMNCVVILETTCQGALLLKTPSVLNKTSEFIGKKRSISLMEVLNKKLTTYQKVIVTD